MKNLVCSQCGGNLLNKLLDGSYQCLYCESIMMPDAEPAKIFKDTAPVDIVTNEYEDPELAELCSMELAEIRERLKTETDSEMSAKFLLAIKDLEEELSNMKIK